MLISNLAGGENREALYPLVPTFPYLIVFWCIKFFGKEANYPTVEDPT
jgi:hypothetical protein